MTIELSSVLFTNKADIVPSLGTIDQLINTGIINTRSGSDIMIGVSTSANFNNVGFNNYHGSLNTGEGNDFIKGIATGGLGYGIQNIGPDAIINTGEGKDIITAEGFTYGLYNIEGSINTGDGSDIITAVGGNIGIANGGTINMGDGRDIITGTATNGNGFAGILNTYIDGAINTGDGNDIITGIGSIGIYNDGHIDTGKGNDIVDASRGGFAGIGILSLGEGNDSLKGFGSGDFNGGCGHDTLRLSQGSYMLGVSGSTVSFTSNGITMNTSAFEKLIAGSTTYNFACLTDGQTITIV